MDWTFKTNLAKMHDKELKGHRNLLMFSLSEYCCVGQKWVDFMIGTNTKMKDIYLYRWCEPTFSSFGCIQSHFCSFKFLFSKPVNGRMFLQDGQKWGTNKFQHAYKEKQQNGWFKAAVYSFSKECCSWSSCWRSFANAIGMCMA